MKLLHESTHPSSVWSNGRVVQMMWLRAELKDWNLHQILPNIFRENSQLFSISKIFFILLAVMLMVYKGKNVISTRLGERMLLGNEYWLLAFCTIRGIGWWFCIGDEKKNNENGVFALQESSAGAVHYIIFWKIS